MTIYVGDQPITAPFVAQGNIGKANATVLDALAGEAPTYVFSAPWTQIYNGQVLSFRPGPSYSIDAALLTALNAASAPITSA